MSSAEKIALMERLWYDLSQSGDAKTPLWHESVLREREGEWKQREQVSQEWEEAKEEIRRELG